MRSRSGVVTRLLTALLLAAALLPAFGAPAGVAQAAEGTAEVNGVGRLVKPSAGFSFAIKVGDNGRALGALSYDDHAARLRLHATRIDSVALADGSVTIAGVGRNGKLDGQAFRLIATEARAGRPARLVFEATDAAGKPYRAESNVRIGSVRVVPAAPRGQGRASPTAAPPSPTVTATPTRTPTPVPTPTPDTSASQKTEVGYAPDAGARLTSADGAVAVEIPPGAIAEPATFSHAELAGPVTVPEARLARTWKLEAQASSDGHLIRQFVLPLSLTVRYTDADLAVLGVPAEKLQLYYQDDAGAWIRIPATVDTTARTVTAAVDHFTVFALGTGEAFETAGGAGTSFVDNFANLNAWTTSAGTGAVAGNILTANGTGGADDRFMLTNASAYTDLTYEAGVSDQSVNANHRAGIILRYSAASGGSYYFAYLNNGQVGLGKVTNGGALANVGPAPVNIGYAQGTFVWLRVVATAANLEVYTAPAASGPWTQRIVAVDATPLVSGGVGLLNDNTGTTTRAARFRDPLVTVTLPQDWSGITQQAGRPGLLWDRTTGSPHGGTGSLQLFSGNGANVGLTAQTTNNANT
ncbi:MAG TPA: hypothetical protein VG370_23355, partial [Chloroflexota bacterium]|nr:hypothetical protein [Chloroflexota bacterium]